MTRLRLDMHGVTVEITGQPGAALDDLSRDFAYFRAGGAAPPDVALELRPHPPPGGRRPAWAPLRWRSARIGRRRGLRVVDYGGRALLEYDLARDRGTLHSAEPDLLHELAYLAVLSRAGERLDRAGLHRAHALGFAYRGRGGLLLLPSGGGKSRLALELLKIEGFRLLADDTPLLDRSGRRLAAFPLGIGLRGEDWREAPGRALRPFCRRRFEEKRMLELESFGARIVPEAPLEWLLLGRRGAAARLAPCGRARAAAAMALPVVLGLGAPQVLELMLPDGLGAALRLARAAASRAAAALRAAAGARCAVFVLGGGPRASALALEGYLRAFSPRAPGAASR